MRVNKLFCCIQRKYGVVFLGLSPWLNLFINGMDLTPLEAMISIMTGFAFFLIVC